MYIVPEPCSLGCWQKWVVGESEEAGRRTLSSHGPENPEKKEIDLSLRKWVPALGPAAEQNKTKHRSRRKESSPEKEQTPTSPGCLHQGRFVDFLDDLGSGRDEGGAALLREARSRRKSPGRCRRTAPHGRWGCRESVPCRRPSSLPG